MLNDGLSLWGSLQAKREASRKCVAEVVVARADDIGIEACRVEDLAGVYKQQLQLHHFCNGKWRGRGSGEAML